MNISTKFTVSRMSFPIDGNLWLNVQVWRSFDGGRNWYYCGYGRHCRNVSDCRAYIAEQSLHETQVVGVEWEEGIKL